MNLLIVRAFRRVTLVSLTKDCRRLVAASHRISLVPRYSVR